MEAKDPYHTLYTLLETKACTKQAVFRQTKAAFETLCTEIDRVSAELGSKIEVFDSSVKISSERKGDYENRLYFSGDLLLFHMHTNAFDFDPAHGVKKLSYVKEDPSRAYCGIIHVYNFLADSFRFNRMNDVGVLIARIFVNKENHFFVEGPKHLGILFNQFSTQVLSPEKMNEVVRACMEYSMQEELRTPPYQYVSKVQVNQMQTLSSELRLRTAKKLGYRMEGEDDVEA